MCYPFWLRDSIHSLSYQCEDVSIFWYLLDILFVQKFLRYSWNMYHDIFCPIHNVVQVKISHVHAHVPLFYVWDNAVNMEFHGGQVWCWCADISCIIYNLSSFGESFPVSLCFLRSDTGYCSRVPFVLIVNIHFWNYYLPSCAYVRELPFNHLESTSSELTLPCILAQNFHF